MEIEEIKNIIESILFALGRVVTLEELKSEMEARYESYRNKQST